MSDRRPLLSRPLPSFRDLNQVTVGLLAVIAVAAVVTGVFVAGTSRVFDDRYQLSAVFTDSGGLTAGTGVRVAGVQVGQVTGIHPDFERGQVVVTFDVDSGVELGTRTRAEIAVNTLLGGYHVRLSGPVDEPFLEDLDGDDPRRRIPLERTQAPVSLVSTLTDTTKTVQAIDVEAVNELLAQATGATERNRDVVPRLIEAVNTIGSATAAREPELRSLIGNADRLTAALADRDDEILRLVDAATVLLDTLSTRRDQLAQVLGDGSDAVAELTETITTHRAAIDDILQSGHVLLDATDRNLATINTSLAQAGPIFTLLGNINSPEGGFDVAVEGLVANWDQLRGLLAVLFPEVTQ